MNTNQIFAILVFTALEAFRTRLWVFVCIAIGVSYVFAGFAATLALTESADYRAVFYGSFVRVTGVFIIISFVTSSIIREFDDRVFDVIVSRAVSRSHWYSGKLLGYLLLVVCFALLAVVPLFLTGANNVASWGISLSFEFVIVMAAAMAFAVTVRNVTVAITAVTAFYLLSRTISSIVLMSEGAAVDLSLPATKAVALIVQSVASVLPNLDVFAQSVWLTESGVVEDLLTVGTQTIIYLLLLTAVGLFDLYRRNQ